MFPLVSIIIPIYKAEKTLSSCIESCLNQTYNNIEIILINDGSPDNSLKICADYAQQDSRIKVIDKANSGVSDTRNAGINQATGDYITFVDADDDLAPDTINQLVAFRSLHNLDLVTAGLNVIRNESHHTTLLPKTEIISGIGDIAKHLASESKLRFYRTPCAKLYKRNLIKEHNLLFDTTLKINEDFIFLMSYLKKCQAIGTYEYCCYNYNQSVTPTKIKHYELQDLQKQWDANLLQFRTYQQFFTETDTYRANQSTIAVYLVTRLRSFVSTAIFARGEHKTIISFLKQIPALPEYNLLYSLKYNLPSGLMAKIALFCIKNKAWNLFYNCFYCKNILYSNRIYRSKKD